MSGDLFASHVPLAKPWLGEEEAAAVREVILSGWVSLGPKVAEFERAVSMLVGARFGVATNSATTAMHLALVVGGIARGDEVICPSFTCMATANAILMAGAVPRFADIEPHTYNLDVASAEAAITSRTRAILLVDQIGLPADLDAFVALAARRRLVLVEDAATAFGARSKGRVLGSMGIPTCFSFHPRKIITTGEGGMFMTDDEHRAERARVLRSAGASVSDLDRHGAKGALLQQYAEAGFNYRFTDIQAAIGLVQLAKLPEMQRQRKQQATFYDAALATIDELEPPYVPPSIEHAYSSYCIRVTAAAPITAAELVVRMASRGISCRHGIQPLHWEPFFQAERSRFELPCTERAARETMFLPIFPGMSDDQQKGVIDALKASLLD